MGATNRIDKPYSFAALAIAFGCGLAFAVASVLSGMTQPAKIIGFLDFWGMAHGAFPGHRDPTRAFVTGGSALFCVGWGLAGYCPGPAIASVISGGADALLFVGAMLVGMVVTRWALRHQA